jgi:hypothetical protein
MPFEYTVLEAVPGENAYYVVPGSYSETHSYGPYAISSNRNLLYFLRRFDNKEWKRCAYTDLGLNRYKYTELGTVSISNTSTDEEFKHQMYVFLQDFKKHTGRRF